MSYRSKRELLTQVAPLQLLPRFVDLARRSLEAWSIVHWRRPGPPGTSSVPVGSCLSSRPWCRSLSSTAISPSPPRFVHSSWCSALPLLTVCSNELVRPGSRAVPLPPRPGRCSNVRCMDNGGSERPREGAPGGCPPRPRRSRPRAAGGMPRNQGQQQPRAVVLVLTVAVHWQTRPRKRPQGLDKEHGIFQSPK
jgi:hypothetical protein